MKKVLVAGGGGFIGGWLVKELLSKGYKVSAVDIKPISNWYQVFPEANNSSKDLSLLGNCTQSTVGIDEIYNLAADMGGMGFIENNKFIEKTVSLIKVTLRLLYRIHKSKNV
jgi:nucleoside-diphosphate-sugar epimerase